MPTRVEASATKESEKSRGEAATRQRSYHAMELTGAALRRSLPSASPAVVRGRRRPARVACVRAGFTDEGHLRYYEAPRKAAVEAVARDLAKLRAMGFVSGDTAKEKVLSEATDVLLQELKNQMKDAEYNMKKVRKEEKAAIKALKKQQKEAKMAAAVMNCEDGSSSESSESDCEGDQTMKVGQGMLVSTATSEDCASGVSTVSAMEREKAAMKVVKKMEKEQKKAAKKSMIMEEAYKAAVMMSCEDGFFSESSESDCEEQQTMKAGQGMLIPTAASEDCASGISTVSGMERDKAAMKFIKKMEKEQKKAAKRAMKLKKEAKKIAMAALNDCRDEDSSSCSSESSESECEGEVVRMSRCATITAPQKPAPSTVLPIVVPQIPESLPPEPLQEPRISSEPATTTKGTIVAVVEKPVANRIEVCMGGKCKKSGALALLQEFEQKVGTGGAVVGCKCLGKCGLGPNVRLRSEGSLEGSVKKNPLCIGVGLEDVDTIVAGLFGDSDLGTAPAQV